MMSVLLGNCSCLLHLSLITLFLSSSGLESPHHSREQTSVCAFLFYVWVFFLTVSLKEEKKPPPPVPKKPAKSKSQLNRDKASDSDKQRQEARKRLMAAKRAASVRQNSATESADSIEIYVPEAQTRLWVKGQRKEPRGFYKSLKRKEKKKKVLSKLVWFIQCRDNEPSLKRAPELAFSLSFK